jgi:hypothetical protein
VTDPTPDVKTMRLRYPGTCAGCGTALGKGERAHYLPTTKTVHCLGCGSGPPATFEVGAASTAAVVPSPPPPAGPGTTDNTQAELTQQELRRGAACRDCERPLKRGAQVLCDAAGTLVLCIECVTLDTVHVLGTPGGGARREHERRQARHHTRIRTAHPKLGGLILALAEDPQHVRAWQTGAVGEEAFGRRLDTTATGHLKVLHDRKLPRSSANIDHLAVTPAAVWVIDAKRYKGRVEMRRRGLLSPRPPDLYVGGRDKTLLAGGVRKQVEAVQEALSVFALDHGLAEPPTVRGALCFVHAEFGLFASPFTIDGVWVGWGKALRKTLAAEGGALPVGDVAKRLARELRPG